MIFPQVHSRFKHSRLTLPAEARKAEDKAKAESGELIAIHIPDPLQSISVTDMENCNL